MFLRGVNFLHQNFIGCVGTTFDNGNRDLALDLFNREKTPFATVSKLRASDISGRLVYKMNLVATNGQIEEQIDLHFLPNGTYQLQINNGEKWGAKRLIIIN